MIGHASAQLASYCRANRRARPATCSGERYDLPFLGRFPDVIPQAVRVLSFWKQGLRLKAYDVLTVQDALGLEGLSTEWFVIIR